MILRVFLLIAACLLAMSRPIAAEAPARPGLVLLPAQGAGVPPVDKAAYRQSLARALGARYQVHLGEELEKKLERSGDKNCDSDACRQSLAREFGASLVGRALVARSDGGFVINLEVRDVFTQRAEINAVRECPRCSREAVIDVIARMVDADAEERAVRAEALAESESWESYAALLLDSEPKGAEVYLGGVRVGATPYRNHRVRVGKRLMLTLKMAGFRDASFSLPVKDGENELSVALTPAFGGLVVDSNPQGAVVRLNGQTVGTTPWRHPRVASGQYRVGLELALYADSEDRFVEVEDGKTSELTFSLTPRFATVAVAGDGEVVTVRNADQQVVKRDKTPFETRLAPGRYFLEISREAHEIRRIEIDAVAGEAIALNREHTRLEKLMGTLSVTTRPYVRGAEVFVDGEAAGHVPATLRLPVGAHQVSVSSDDRFGDQLVEIKERKPTTVAVALAAKPRAGRNFRDCADCPEMVPLPGGRFRMGTGTAGPDEKPAHPVSIPAFAIGRQEVTRGQWRAFVEETGYGKNDACLTFEGGIFEEQSQVWRRGAEPPNDEHPVTCVNWDDARAYAAWLGKKTGKPYRLPTEAEWEYAARAGTVTSRFWGNAADQACRFSNVMDQTGKAQVPNVGWEAHACNDRHAYTAPVGRYRANPFGLQDMIGNVWEWTLDCGNDSYTGAPVDGSAWLSGDCGRRVLRGGAWNVRPLNARVSTRYPYVRSLRNDVNGFRVVSGRPAGEREVDTATRANCPECPEMVGVLPEKPLEKAKGGQQVPDVPAFRIGRTEVTQQQWRAVMDYAPSVFGNCDECPVDNVSWEDIQVFLRRINEKTGRAFRLPSELEWERACRAGRTYRFCGGQGAESVAWLESNSRAKTHAVGRRLPNALGLYDMSGNVREWVSDCMNKAVTPSSPGDGSSAVHCGYRILRGGSWADGAAQADATARHFLPPSARDAKSGFRLAESVYLGQ